MLDDAVAIYRGWVPTVGGRLSFDVFGKGSHPRRPHIANKSDENTRFVLCSQKRFLADTPLPLRHLSTKLLGMDGNFKLVCVGSSPNNSTHVEADLVGTLFIFKMKRWSDKSVGIKKFFNEMIAKLSTYDSRLHGSLKSAFNDDYLRTLASFEKKADFHVKFNLTRSGVATLWIPKYQEIRPDAPRITDISECNPTFFEKAITLISKGIERLQAVFSPCTEFIRSKEDPERQKNDLRREICQQLFFFLKDITHNHQHHDPYTDTMSLLYQLQNATDDYFWRSDTLRNLYRMVLNYKRSMREEVFASALGILAYLKSFYKISATELRQSENSDFIKFHGLSPRLSDNLLAQSITAGQIVIRNEIQEKIRMSEKLQSILISTLGLMFGAIAILQLNAVQDQAETKYGTTVSPTLLWFCDHILRHPIIVIFVAGTTVAILFSVLNIKKIIQIKQLRSLFRSIYVIGRTYAAMFFIVMGLAIFCLTWRIFSYTGTKQSIMFQHSTTPVKTLSPLSAHDQPRSTLGTPEIRRLDHM
jgi:hypothetical protein